MFITSSTVIASELPMQNTCLNKGTPAWIQQLDGIELKQSSGNSAAKISYKTPVVLIDKIENGNYKVMLHGWFNPSFKEWEIINENTIRIPWRGGKLRADPEKALVPTILAELHPKLIHSFISQFKIKRNQYFELCLEGYLPENAVTKDFQHLKEIDHKNWLATFEQMKGIAHINADNELKFSAIRYEQKSQKDKSDFFAAIVTLGLSEVNSGSWFTKSIKYLPIYLSGKISVKVPFNKMSSLELFSAGKSKPGQPYSEIVLKNGTRYQGIIEQKKKMNSSLNLLENGQLIRVPLMSDIKIIFN